MRPPPPAASRTAEEEEYLRNVGLVEQRVENQSGSDKSWVERAIEESRKHFEQAVRVR